MEKLNVAIADDNERMVQLLDEIVASDKDLQVVGTAKNGVEAYEIIKHKQPDVVLLDIVMPKLDGLALLEKVKKEQTEDLITLHTDQGSVYSSESYNKLIENYNIQRSMSRAGTPTDNPVNESLNGWIKEELFIDFDLKHCDNISKLIEEYVCYYNYERPSYALNYKTPIQYKIESGF